MADKIELSRGCRMANVAEVINRVLCLLRGLGCFCFKILLSFRAWICFGVLFFLFKWFRVELIEYERKLRDAEHHFYTDPCRRMDSYTPLVVHSKLPRIIHQTWPKSKPMPAHTKRWFNKWDELFPGFEHRLWDDEEIERLIKDDFPGFLPTFQKYPLNILKVDAARTFLLYKYGGLYADMDYEPLTHFWDRLPDDAPALIESPWPYEEFQNSFMSSPPGHPFWNYTWALMEERARERPNPGVPDILYLTGPNLIGSTVGKFHGMFPKQNIRTLPCQNWQRFAAEYANEAKDRTEKYYSGFFKNCGVLQDTRCHFGIHHTTTTWAPKKP